MSDYIIDFMCVPGMNLIVCFTLLTPASCNSKLHLPL